VSVLEFIAALKWPVVVLVALGVVSRGFKRNPDMGRWFRGWLDSRDVRGKIGPTEFEATASRAVEAAAGIAAASDEHIADNLAASLGQAGTAQSDGVHQLRREAVEALMRDSAKWGWVSAQMGFRSPPDPDIRWQEDGRPNILYWQEKPFGDDPESKMLEQMTQAMTGRGPGRRG